MAANSRLVFVTFLLASDIFTVSVAVIFINCVMSNVRGHKSLYIRLCKETFSILTYIIA